MRSTRYGLSPLTNKIGRSGQSLITSSGVSSSRPVNCWLVPLDLPWFVVSNSMVVLPRLSLMYFAVSKSSVPKKDLALFARKVCHFG